MEQDLPPDPVRGEEATPVNGRQNNNDYLLAVLSSTVYIMRAGNRFAGGNHGTGPGPGPGVPAGRWN
jgi:hypothetical protein